MDVINPTSRFKVLDSAILAPGTCVLCRSAGGDGRKFIDLGMQVDFFGAVYFCSFCITEAASILGLKSSLETESYIQGLLDSQKTHLAIIEGLREEINASRVLLRNCYCGDSDSSDSGTDSISAAVEDNPDSDESGSEQGSDGIPSFASYDELAAAAESKPRTRRARKSDE